MSKTHDIFSTNDFQEFVNHIYRYIRSREAQKLPFQRLKIITKRWTKGKTRAAHNRYWALINELKDALKESGNILNQEQIHEFIKREAGFTEMVEMPNGKNVLVTKSIADSSDDVDSKEINWLMDYIVMWAAENLDCQLGSSEI